MDGLAEFAQPQLLAGLVAITVLGMAVMIESLMLWAGVSFKVSRSAEVAEPPAAEPFAPEFYDWLYE